MTNIIIMVGDKAIGAIQSIKIEEKKTETTDGYYTNVTVTAARIRFSKERIKEAFNKGMLHAATQVYPFDIVIMDNHLETARLHNVWLMNTDYMYDATEWVIIDQAMMEAEEMIGSIDSSCPQ